LEAIANVTFLDERDIISKISLPRFTFGRGIEELSNDIEETLKGKVVFFSNR
jgi:hypothetical protein